VCNHCRHGGFGIDIREGRDVIVGTDVDGMLDSETPLERHLGVRRIKRYGTFLVEIPDQWFL
jgi:hypothetical protein